MKYLGIFIIVKFIHPFMYTLSKCIGYYCDYFQVKADTQKGIMLAIDVLSNYIKK